MPPHRGIAHISERELAKVVASTPMDHFVYWTGGTYRRQTGSLRSSSLELITEVRAPVPVRELLTRAARIVGERGMIRLRSARACACTRARSPQSIYC